MNLEKEDNYVKYIYLLLFLGSLISCSEYSKENREYHDFVNCQVEHIQKNHKLKLYGIGGFNDEGIEGYSFTFSLEAKVDKEYARELIVNLVEDLVSNGNACLNSLGKLPIIRSQYRIGIVFFNKSTGTFFSPDQGLAKVSYFDEKIRFVTNESEAAPLETLSIESYQDAYEKVFGKQLDKDSM